MDDVIALIKEVFTRDTIGQKTATETSRNVFCRIKSVSRAEFFDAGAHGLKPELVVEMPAANYDGEELASYGGKRYSVYRVYNRDADGFVELYLERRVGA